MMIQGKPLDTRYFQLPPKLTQENVERMHAFVLKSYENQFENMTKETYYQEGVDTFDVRIAAELKKKLDKEFRTNTTVIFGISFAAKVGVPATKSPESKDQSVFFISRKNFHGVEFKTIVFESHVREVPFLM